MGSDILQFTCVLDIFSKLLMETHLKDQFLLIDVFGDRINAVFVGLCVCRPTCSLL